jgi:PadR family transcriptional regulator, regulatory protein PadR
MDEESAELKKFRKELNAGAVSLVLLALLDGAAAPMYGYQIARRLDELADGTSLVKQGTLYPLLRSMESNGLLASEVEPSVTGPPRRYYTIAEPGRRLLPLWRGAWEQTRDFVDSVLGGALSSAVPDAATIEAGGDSLAPAAGPAMPAAETPAAATPSPSNIAGTPAAPEGDDRA